jgi:hypothetical protein
MSTLTSLFGSAAQLAQKQAALATLHNVTFPKLFHAIGKRIITVEKLPVDLEEYRSQIRELERVTSARPEVVPEQSVDGFAAKAKHLAQKAAKKASQAATVAAANVRIQSAYVAMGQRAVSEYGEKAVPESLRAQLSELNKQQASLTAEIQSLKARPGWGVFSPSRLAIGGLGVTVLLVGFVAIRSLVGGSRSDSAASLKDATVSGARVATSEMENTRPRQRTDPIERADATRTVLEAVVGVAAQQEAARQAQQAQMAAQQGSKPVIVCPVCAGLGEQQDRNGFSHECVRCNGKGVIEPGKRNTNSNYKRLPGQP